jgi:hypothetical protein
VSGADLCKESLLGVVGARVNCESLSGYFGSSFAGGGPSFAYRTLVFGIGAIRELVRVPCTGREASRFNLGRSALVASINAGTHLDGPIDICTRKGISFRDDLFILGPDFIFYTLRYIDPVLSSRVSPSPK